MRVESGGVEMGKVSSPSLPEVLKPEVSLFAGMGRTAP